MRSYSFDPGLLNGRLLQQEPVPRFERPEGEFWDLRDPRGEHPGSIRMAGGTYDFDELARYGSIAAKGMDHVRNEMGYDDAEAQDFIKRHGSPQQGRLFDPEVGRGGQDDHAARESALSEHTVGWLPSRSSMDRFDQMPQGVEKFQLQGQLRGKAQGQAMAGMYESRMSNDLLKALGGRTWVSEDLEGHRENVGGFYRPGFGRMTDGEISLRAQPTPGTNQDDFRTGVLPGVLRHEMGHRADYRSMNAEANDTAEASRAAYIGLGHPNPRAEGIADGFDDRYNPDGPPTSGRITDPPRPEGSGPSFKHFAHTGYSTEYPGFKGEYSGSAAAVYAASRAHFQMTGENPTGGSATEYLHKMMMTSPHAVRALRQLGLKQHGASAVDRYRSMRQVGTQMSMFSEFTATDQAGTKRHLEYTPHPALTGENPWGKKPDPKNTPRPGETRRYESMDKPVYDIPDDHKPKKA